MNTKKDEESDEDMEMTEEKAKMEEEMEEDTSIWRIVDTSSPPIFSLSEFEASLNIISTSFTLRSFTYSICFS